MPADDVTISQPNPADSLTLTYAESTSVGRRSYNEDVVAGWQNDAWACFVVADGAGGHGGGDVAARIAADSIIQAFSNAPTLEPENIESWVRQANDLILERQKDGGNLAHMHTTIVAAFIDRKSCQIRWVNVGDSRLYLFRDRELLFKTKDHSTVQALIDSGALSEDACHNHPRRNELYAALGEPTDSLPIQACEFALRLWPNDLILMCTDGIWEYFDDAALHAFYQQSSGDLSVFLSALTEQVLEENPDKKVDNLSAIAFRIQ